MTCVCACARNERKVAMKIVRKGCQDYESAVMEVRVLEAIQKNDPDMSRYATSFH